MVIVYDGVLRLGARLDLAEAIEYVRLDLRKLRFVNLAALELHLRLEQTLALALADR